jgi:hypothetical protein
MRKVFFALCFSSVLLSCSTDEKPGRSAYQNEVITYFQEIALGFEFGSAPEVTYKWQTEMKIFVGGNPGTELSSELQTIIGEINSLTSDGFRMSLTQDTTISNCYLYFGSAAQFTSMFPSYSSAVAGNWGLFYVNFDSHSNLYRATIFIDIQRAQGNEQKHLLREELTQSLGLAKDSPRYLDSIFQQAWTTTTTYSTIDKDLIRLLYHPGMYSGMGREPVRELLPQLVSELDI